MLGSLAELLEKDGAVIADVGRYREGYALALDTVLAWGRGYVASMVQTGRADADDHYVRVCLRRDRGGKGGE